MMKNLRNRKKPPQKSQKTKFPNGLYSVVKFIEAFSKSFECIPDIWFENEEKTRCFWPPKSKKSITLRIMNQDILEDDWSCYDCELVSEHHATYSIAVRIANEKAAQKYNTSSADEYLQQTQFRREHPGLIHNGEKNFEHVFQSSKGAAAPSKNEMKEAVRNKEAPTKTDGKVHHEKDKEIEDSNNETRTRGIRLINSPQGSKSKEKKPVNSLSRSRSNQSKSLSNHSQFSGSRSSSRNSSLRRSRPRSKYNRSRSKSNRSRSERNRSRSESNRSRSESDPSRSESNPSRPRRSRSNGSRRESRSRSKSHSTRYHSYRGRSKSRSNYSHSSRNGSDSNLKGNNQSQHFCSKTSTDTARSIYPNSSGNRSTSRTENNLNASRATRRLNSRPRWPDSHDREKMVSRSIHERRQIEGKSNLRDREKHTFKNQHHVKRLSRGSQNQEFVVSPKTRNKIRVEEMYRLHHQQRAVNRENISENMQSSSSPQLSLRHSGQPHNAQEPNNVSILLTSLMKDVSDIKTIISKNDRRFVESDRRLTRLEVTANKTFIVLGDLANAMNARMTLAISSPTEIKPPRGYHAPKLPLKRFKDLEYLQKDFSNKRFFNFLVNREKEYCAYSTSTTDTVAMTAYLKRFISVDLRASLVLKELKGDQGLTLYHDFSNVYNFLIEVMKNGYQLKGKVLTINEVHKVLRTVWGRSKQALDAETKKRQFFA